MNNRRTPHTLATRAWRRIALALWVLTAGALAAQTPERDWAALTGFSWERVPVYLHFGKRHAAMTPAELDFVAAHSPFVALEKSHGVVPHGSTEAGIAHTARELKRRNPRIKVLFYLNAFINWSGYEALERFKPEWLLRNGAGEIVKHPSGTPRPDPTLPEMRAWWVASVAEAVERGGLDGVFADALPQAIAPGLARQVGPEKARAVVAGLRTMLLEAKRRLGPERVVLANGTRTKDFREILDWEGLDGVMIEHFGGFHTAGAADMREDLETLRLAAARGKFVVLKGWPGFNWQDKEAMARPAAELLARARAGLEFPLTCFLVAAQPGSFFCYSWGYVSDHGMLESYPEFGRRLGPPRGEAVWDGLTARREFAHASVWLDLAAKQARIEWR